MTNDWDSYLDPDAQIQWQGQPDTRYAIRTKRAFIAQSAFGQNARLGFDAASKPCAMMQTSNVWHRASDEFAFRAIPDGKAVYALVRNIQREHST